MIQALQVQKKNRLKHNSIPTHNVHSTSSQALLEEYDSNLKKWKGKKLIIKTKNKKETCKWCLITQFIL